MPQFSHSHSQRQHGSNLGQQRWGQNQQPSLYSAVDQSAAMQNSPQLHARLLNSAGKQSAAFGPKFKPTTAGNSPYLRSPASAFGSPQLGSWSHRPRQKPLADPDKKLTELLEELHMHQPYNPLSPMTGGISKQQVPQSTPARQDLDEVLAKYVQHLRVRFRSLSYCLSVAAAAHQRHQQLPRVNDPAWFLAVQTSASCPFRSSTMHPPFTGIMC